MTDWTDFTGNPSNGALVTQKLLQQIINNTTNIYERVMVLESLKGGGVPVGAVMLWKGSYATIPDGYQLADGTNGTPDLRGKFLMGIASTEGDDNLLETGGESSHTNTLGALSTSSAHTHNVYMNSSGALVNAQSGGATQVAMAGHNHAWSAVTGSSGAHTHTGAYTASDHLPPYTKYYWIARIPA